ncbi:hypothetical protein JCM21714_1698 [Gracilibacillus boraciitolerans JCM 21714]|uniref:Polysaccharide biosynthesis protein CapD-like domain-containing protein n=1 Tax=Gracilibacillus boraciitolerans JCM 21714 TaxID=1298598 RepID=W4VHK6_9BACI|nr:hypothetical protein JCM21714_1698 [Gracilibacillus boraciitolerans JCM 21714]
MFFKDKTILVIGGTGTIGTSVVKEILNDNPKKSKYLVVMNINNIKFAKGFIIIPFYNFLSAIFVI